MLKGENIIVFSSADWKIGPTSPQHISTNFAQESNKVLFIETFGSRVPSLEQDHRKRMKDRFLNWSKGVRKLNVKKVTIYIYSPITFLPNFRPFLFINRFIFLNILKRLIKKLDMKNPILYFYLPPPAGVIGKLKEKAIIYHSVDDWLTFPGWRNKIFMDSERDLINNADLVLAANEHLYRNEKPYARRIVKMYHGVDYNHFGKEFAKDIPLPEDVKSISRPILAIVGAFANWIDLDLIKLIAQRYKKCSIISIGTVEDDVDISSLSDISNIHFLGQKKYSDLPNYYRAIDVFIIPFILTEHTMTCAPTRLYEHLSSGKPIIATDFSAAHEVGEDLIYIASDREDFVKKIEAALKEKDPSLIERRKELAKKNTWKSKIEEISGIIEKILKEKKVKVLHIITRLNSGGAQEIALSIASELDKNRFDVTFISGPQDFCIEMANKWNINVVIIPDLIREINPIKDLKALIKLYLFIKKNRFDIVHTHTSKAGILGRVAARLTGVPITLHTPHGSIYHSIYYSPKTIFLLSKIENFVTSFTDKIITCSENEKKDFLEYKIGKEDKYATIYWGIKQDNYLKVYNSALKRKELGVPEDIILIGNVARLVPEKGHIFCLEAFKTIVDRLPKTMLLIVGGGILKHDIEAKIKELGLNNNVIMAGHRDDIPEILAGLDISLHTSIWEGTPIAIIEAMLAGKAIVATKVGGIPELIEDGITGILVPPYDKNALIQAITTLINNKALAKKIGETARQRTKEKFSLELMIGNITRLYEKAIELKILK